MAAIAGKVAITPKGVWDVATQYEKLDFVLYGDDSYVARKESVGVEPGTDEETWMLSLRGASAQQIQDIISGTTTVGNADKLDGKSAEEFTKFNPTLVTSVEELKSLTESMTTNQVLIGEAIADIPDIYSGAVRGVYIIQRDIDPYGTITFIANGILTLNQYANGSWVGWKTYLPTTGGTLSDYLWSSNDGKGFASFVGSNNCAFLEVWNANKNARRKIRLANTDATANDSDSLALGTIKSDGTYVEQTILHTGNKPTGTYTGNGDATQRVIATGGIGNYLLLSNGADFFLVTTGGALHFNPSTGHIACIASDKLRFLDGNLYINSNDDAINGNGYGFYYYVP